MPHPCSIDIVTKRYFDGVDNKNMTQVLGSFTDDAILTEVTSKTVHDGKDAIEAMFTRLFSDFSSIWHGNFVHVTDPESNSICSQFTVLITPNGGSGLHYEPTLSRVELIDLALTQYSATSMRRILTPFSTAFMMKP